MKFYALKKKNIPLYDSLFFKKSFKKIMEDEGLIYTIIPINWLESSEEDIRNQIWFEITHLPVRFRITHSNHVQIHNIYSINDLLWFISSTAHGGPLLIAIGGPFTISYSYLY